MRSPHSRCDFNDRAAYAKSMRLHGPVSAEGLEHFEGLAGADGALLDAVWGTAGSRDAELEAETTRLSRSRPHVFVRKFWRTASPPSWTKTGTLLGEDEVAEILSASAFSLAQGWPLDFSATISFGLVGANDPSDVRCALNVFTRLFAQLLRDMGLPCAFIAVTENAPTIGLHTHVIVNAPVHLRARIKQWIVSFAVKQSRARSVSVNAKAVKIRGHKNRQLLLHDRLVSYLLKGCDPNAVVRAADETLDRREVRLIDLIADDFMDPGNVPFPRIYIGSSLRRRARGSWRSAYELGSRDIRDLYQPDFLRWVSSRTNTGWEEDTSRIARLRQAADDMSATLDAMCQDAIEGYAALTCYVTLEALISHLDRLACDTDAAMKPNPAPGNAIAIYRKSVRVSASLIDLAGQRIEHMRHASDLSPLFLHKMLQLLTDIAIQVDVLLEQVGEQPSSSRWRLSVGLDRLSIR